MTMYHNPTQVAWELVAKDQCKDWYEMKVVKNDLARKGLKLIEEYYFDKNHFLYANFERLLFFSNGTSYRISGEMSNTYDREYVLEVAKRYESKMEEYIF